MAQNSSLQQLIVSLVESHEAGRTGLAADLGVAESTVARWLHGTRIPRPVHATKIRALAANLAPKSVHEPVIQYDSHHSEREDVLRAKLHTILSEIREALHKGGRLSSRQEALDETTKLLFAHVVSIIQTGVGISITLPGADAAPASALRSFVSDVFNKYLPSSLRNDLDGSVFELNIKDSETRYARELIVSISKLDANTVNGTVASTTGTDILNEVFGQFLSSSFVDEKELGQYLTPIEVVRFMTRLGLSSIPRPIYKKLIDPDECGSVGNILDPSCGVGSFLTEAIRVLHPQVVAAHGAERARHWLRRMLCSRVIGLDKSERMIRLSLANLAMLGADSTILSCINALDRDGPDASVTDELDGSAQLILTNPPFGANFPASELSKYEIANQWCARRPTSVDSELLFLERYIDWLRPGGSLVTIVPDSILTNKGLFGDLRYGISKSIELRSVVSLPSVTFAAAGTTTKTSVLHLVKRSNGPTNKPVYFAMCKDIGYSIATRSSHKKKIKSGTNDLVDLLPEAIREQQAKQGRLIGVPPTAHRWDAAYHAGLSTSVATRLANAEKTDIFLRDVAKLANARVNPARSLTSCKFAYVEISDVNAETLQVSAKQVRCEDAPSRARKLIRANNVLVSTVRPERRTIGVVPKELDGSVCSTGFAVLACTRIDPTILALLLQSDFVTEQILRNNIGIAYPAIAEDCLLDILLPITHKRFAMLSMAGEHMRELQGVLSATERKLKSDVHEEVAQWSST